MLIGNYPTSKIDEFRLNRRDVLIESEMFSLKLSSFRCMRLAARNRCSREFLLEILDYHTQRFQ